MQEKEKKKSLSAGDLRSPGPAATRNRCVHHLREPLSRPPSRLSGSPCLLRGLPRRLRRRGRRGGRRLRPGGPCGRGWMRGAGAVPPATSPCCLWGEAADRGGGARWVRRALAPGSGNWGPGFGGREGPRAAPALQRGCGVGGVGRGRCKSLKLKQGPAASWGAAAAALPPVNGRPAGERAERRQLRQAGRAPAQRSARPRPGGAGEAPALAPPPARPDPPAASGPRGALRCPG